MVRSFPQGPCQRGFGPASGGLLLDGCEQVEVGDELATAADGVDPLLPEWQRRAGRSKRRAVRLRLGQRGLHRTSTHTTRPIRRRAWVVIHVAAHRAGPQGPYDQTPVEQRSDVLLYSSEPLKADTEITGPVTVDLWASSSAPDTDFTAKLDVVKPDGEVINLNNGIVRTAFRDSLSSPQPADPGRPHEYQISVWPTSYLFRAGEVIRPGDIEQRLPPVRAEPEYGPAFWARAPTRNRRRRRSATMPPIRPALCCRSSRVATRDRIRSR